MLHIISHIVTKSKLEVPIKYLPKFSRKKKKHRNEKKKTKDRKKIKKKKRNNHKKVFRK